MKAVVRFENVRFPEGSGSFSFSLSPGVNRLLPSEKEEREIVSFLFPVGTEGKLVLEGEEFDLSRPGDASLFLLECRFKEGGVLSSLLPVDEKEGARVLKDCLALEGKPLRERVMGVMSLLEGKGALYFIVEERDAALLSLVRNIYPPFGSVPLLILGEEEGRRPMPESRIRFRSGNFEREPFLKDMKLNLGEYLFQALFMFLASSLSIFGVRSLLKGEDGLVAGVCLAVGFLVLLVFLNSVRSSLSLLLKRGKGPLRLRRMSLVSGLAGSLGAALSLLLAYVLEATSFLGGFLDGFGNWSLFLCFLAALLSFVLSLGVLGSLMGRKKNAD